MQHIQKIVTKIARIKNVTFTNGHSFTLCDKDATACLRCANTCKTNGLEYLSRLLCSECCPEQQISKQNEALL